MNRSPWMDVLPPPVSIKVRPLEQRVFDAGLPCPDCHRDSVIGYLFFNEDGQHMHTRYVCTFWPKGEGTGADYRGRQRCGWSGWSVPGWNGDGIPEGYR